MSIKPVGGRGLKAPYQTITIRIPKPLSNYFTSIVNDYRQKAISSNQLPNIDLYKLNSTNELTKFSKSEAIEKAQKLLRHRKGAKVTLEKLLQVLYEDKNINL